MVDRFHAIILRADEFYGDFNKGKHRKTSVLLTASSIIFIVLCFMFLLAFKNIIDIDTSNLLLRVLLVITCIFNHFFLGVTFFIISCISSALKDIFPLDVDIKYDYKAREKRIGSIIILVLIFIAIIFSVFID